MAHEAGLRDSAWARRWEGRGGGVAAGRGLVDSLSLLKVRALWLVALRLLVLLGCGCWCWWFVTLIWNRRQRPVVASLLRVVDGTKLTCTCVLAVIVGCDRHWCRMADRSVGLMCRSSGWWVCRCDWLRRRWWRVAAAEDHYRWWWTVPMNNIFFFVIRTVHFF